jgi:hypothetical protein
MPSAQAHKTVGCRKGIGLELGGDVHGAEHESGLTAPSPRSSFRCDSTVSVGQNSHRQLSSIPLKVISELKAMVVDAWAEAAVCALVGLPKPLEPIDTPRRPGA